MKEQTAGTRKISLFYERIFMDKKKKEEECDL